ncbi:hypothetical protein H5P28_01710 [Ruficoccus amylovorans]|uniref:PEP-CTERM sorting domain-containing protein n=1 Tax=Ruficoccus amylovorans TaxID=1804625 RepID=A0A842HB72_9BACT|nr:hypothetical protein [Ruficoccus amylovorans]MBC2592966.1 hypothetical protein [Ruficoccus amylovorans]
MLRGTKIIVFMVAALLAASAQGAITPGAGYTGSTVLTGRSFGAFDIYTDAGSGSSYAYGWTGGALKQYSMSSGAETGNLGAPDADLGSAASPSFVSYNPSDGSVWVGFTNWQNPAIDRIYKVSSSGEWTQVNSLTNNYSLAFYNTEAFVMAGNTVYWIDGETGSTTAFAQFGTNSAQLTFGDSGMVVGTYGLTGDNYILGYSNAQLNSFLQTMELGGTWTPLLVGDGDILETYSMTGNNGGIGGVAVGEDGTIYYSGNDYSTYETLITDSDGNVIGTALYDGIVYLDELDGKLYYTTWSQDGISVLEAVPEPSVYALAGGIFMLAFSLYYRRRVTRLRE